MRLDNLDLIAKRFFNIKKLIVGLFGLAALAILLSCWPLNLSSNASRPVDRPILSVDSVEPGNGPTTGGDSVTLRGDFGEIQQTAEVFAGNIVSYIVDTNGQIYAAVTESVNCGWLGIGLGEYDDCSGSGLVNISQAAAGAINSGTKIRQVAHYDENIYAIDEAGSLYVWGGRASHFQLPVCSVAGVYNKSDCDYEGGLWQGANYYVDVEGNITAPINLSALGYGAVNGGVRLVELLSAGEHKFFAISDQGHIYAWSPYDYNGYPGDGSDQFSTVPVDINLLAAGDIMATTRIKQASVADWAVFAVDEDGQVYTWGYNQFGLLGLGAACTVFDDWGSAYQDETSCTDNGGVWDEANNIAESLAPINISQRGAGAINSGTNIVQLSTNLQSSVVALDSNGQVYTWGVNDYSNLGVGPGFGYCSDAVNIWVDLGSRPECETAAGLWHDSVPNAYAPVSVNQAALGDITASTEIVKVGANNKAVWAIDRIGQLYLWGGETDSSFGWYCHEYAQYDTYPQCQAAGGNWDQRDGTGSNYNKVAASAPKNISASGLGDLAAGSKIDKLIGRSNNQAEEDVLLILDEAGRGYWLGNQNISDKMRYTCWPDGLIANQTDCEAAGGAWYQRYADGEFVPFSVNLGFGEVDASTQITSGDFWCGEGCYYAWVDTAGDVYVGLYDPESDSYLPQSVGQIASPVAPAEYEVMFGAAPCQEVTIIDRHTLTCVTSQHQAGLVDVTVSSAGATDTLDDGYEYVELYIEVSNSAAVDLGTIQVNSSGVAVATSNAVFVKTNNPSGYQLRISTDSDSSDMKHLSLAGYALPAIGDGSSTGTLANPIALADNTWGFAIANSAGGSVSNGFDASYDTANFNPTSKWARVPSSNSPLIIKSTSAPNETASGDETVIYYGAKANIRQMAGKYGVGIVYTAIANP